jgi:hypothetical protein
MSARPDLRLTDTDDLPDYPLDASVKLTSHYFTMFWHDRWLASELHLTGSLEVQACALNLIFLAQKQSPLGTLPDNDEILSRMLRLDLLLWRDLRKRNPGPLHNWSLCRCGREVRLMHPVVLEVLQEAIGKRDERMLSNEEKAQYTRLKRIREALADLGCTEAVTDDGVLIDRLDQWLTANCQGQRRRPVYARALQHAVAAGWLAQPGKYR